MINPIPQAFTRNNQIKQCSTPRQPQNLPYNKPLKGDTVSFNGGYFMDQQEARSLWNGLQEVKNGMSQLEQQFSDLYTKINLLEERFMEAKFSEILAIKPSQTSDLTEPEMYAQAFVDQMIKDDLSNLSDAEQMTMMKFRNNKAFLGIFKDIFPGDESLKDIETKGNSYNANKMKLLKSVLTDMDNATTFYRDEFMERLRSQASLMAESIFTHSATLNLDPKKGTFVDGELANTIISTILRETDQAFKAKSLPEQKNTITQMSYNDKLSHLKSFASQYKGLGGIGKAWKKEVYTAIEDLATVNPLSVPWINDQMSTFIREDLTDFYINADKMSKMFRKAKSCEPQKPDGFISGFITIAHRYE